MLINKVNDGACQWNGHDVVISIGGIFFIECFVCWMTKKSWAFSDLVAAISAALHETFVRSKYANSVSQFLLCTSHLFPRPPHPRDIRGLCRAIAGELLQLCDDFMPRPPGNLPQICLTLNTPGKPRGNFQKQSAHEETVCKGFWVHSSQAAIQHGYQRG